MYTYPNSLSDATLAAMAEEPKVCNYLDTVSYTHLRAHETVLDIVCRLLLAKKTYKNRTTPSIFIHS